MLNAPALAAGATFATMRVRERGCACGLALLLCATCVPTSAQFLKTTCPKVALSSCPGTCAAPFDQRSRSAACEGGTCGGEAGDGSAPIVPQRVLPAGSAALQPPEPPEQQAAIVAHLREVYDNAAKVRGPAESVASSGSLQESGPASVAALPMVSRSSSPYSGPDSQVSRTLTFLNSSKLSIGLDMQRAGAISWLSSGTAPAPWRGLNLVNVWDQGRLIQQSYYGCVDGSCWATRPWLWNPVQGGSWENKPGVTTKQQVVTPGKRLYVEGTPRNWGSQELIRSVMLVSDVSMADGYAVARFTVKYSGSVTHPYMTQEVPAVFVDRRLSVLAYYAAARPWTGHANITYAFPPGRNVYARPTEQWAAFLDPKTGWGVGVFAPAAWHGITAYRVGDDGSDKPWDCSYFAHTIRMQLHPGMKPYSYTAYITTGTLPTMRALFARLAATPGVMPKSRAAAGVAGDGAVEEPVPTTGQPTLGRNAWYGSPADYRAFDNVVLPDGPDGSNGAHGAGSGSGGSSARGGATAGAVIGAVAGAALLAGVGVAAAAAVRRRRRGAVDAAATAAGSGGAEGSEAACGHATQAQPAARSQPVLQQAAA